MATLIGHGNAMDRIPFRLRADQPIFSGSNGNDRLTQIQTPAKIPLASPPAGQHQLNTRAAIVPPHVQRQQRHRAGRRHPRHVGRPARAEVADDRQHSEQYCGPYQYQCQCQVGDRHPRKARLTAASSTPPNRATVN